MSAGRLRALYLNTASSTPYATPTWTHVSRISDVQRSRSRSTNDRAYRGAKNKKKVTGYKEYGFSFKYHVKKAGATDTVADEFEDSYTNETVLDVCFMNGLFTTGTTRVGERGPCVVSKMDIIENDEEGVTYDIELVEVEDEQPAGTLFEFAAFSVTTS